MTLTSLTPFRSGLNDIALLQNRLNSIFQDFARPSEGTESLLAGSFVPAVDVYEDAEKLVMKFEVPGIRREDLDIRVEGRTLTVKGERKFESEEKEENFHRIERRYGSFLRSFTLPSTINTEKVEATSADGVLSISFAKKPEAQPKQIQVQVAPAAQKQVEAKTKA
ncbi:MAG: Hsp20/alpha crystallin family protein [Acidobacteriota bacterium]|jgi:HSP20 family protein